MQIKKIILYSHSGEKRVLPFELGEVNIITGESRNITAKGIFTHCKEQLHENETYRVIIGLPKKRYLAVKGKLIWSNLDGIDANGAYSEMGFSFVKLFGEDRHLLNRAVSTDFA